MRQVLQNLGSGETILAEVPTPRRSSGGFLVQTSCSLVSIGTEKMLLDFGKAGWLDKARKQPDKVKQVLAKIKTDGLVPTIEAVKSKLDQPIALGYCNVGRVLEAEDRGLRAEYRVRDRIISNGPHAEIVSVPKNLCAKVPDLVSDEEAAFTVIGAIGLEGIRLIQPTLGESIVVTGLGLIGLMAVQMLRAHGCHVLGIDFDSSKCALARQFGADTVDLSKGEDPISAAGAFSLGRGVDGVLITASTQSNEPVHQAATMCRKRGRIVLVGVVGLQLSRADFYEKELTFQVSCSYGPGRYDENYEQKGQDYPIGYVRWTEQRNFEAVLALMADRRIDVRPLISHRFAFDEALQAYAMVGDKRALGIVLKYGKGTEDGGKKTEDRRPKIEENAFGRTIALKPPTAVLDPSSVISPQSSDIRPPTSPTIGLIGAGNFTGMVLLPALAKTGARLKTIASAGGVTGTHFGRKFGFELSTTDTDSIFADPEINTVLITTRHNSHAKYVLQALRAGKHVYVEKPLCLNREELAEILEAIRTAKHAKGNGTNESEVAGGVESSHSLLPTPLLMVGFNRRFAPQVVKIKSLLDSVKEPKTLIMTVNAGAILANHWTQDPEIGGGRIIGEGCHFIDLLRHLVGHPIESVQTAQIDPGDSGVIADDKMTFTLTFADGSIGTVHYFANGHKSFPKERLEVFCAGRVLQLDNFRKLTGYGWPRFKKMNLWRQDKGHAAEMEAFINAASEGKPSPIPFGEIVNVTEASFDVVEKARRRTEGIGNG